MAKIFSNKKTDKTYYFNDKFENKLRNMLKRNLHDEIRAEIASQMGMTEFAEKFSKFIYLPWKTAEQMTERYKLTQKFLREVTSLFGIDAMRYITQFL